MTGDSVPSPPSFSLFLPTTLATATVAARPAPQLAASLLSADCLDLKTEFARCQAAGIDGFHLDLMDGHFVPNLGVGLALAQAVARHFMMQQQSCLMDAHLMVTDPTRWVRELASVGVHRITVHVEAAVHLQRLLTLIRSLGCQVGVALNPATPLGTLEEVLDLVDVVLLMSVNPGFSGQSFLPQTINKLHRLVALRQQQQPQRFLIQVDGGVNESNLAALYQAGADQFVLGLGLFSYPDYSARVRELREVLRVAATVS